MPCTQPCLVSLFLFFFMDQSACYCYCLDVMQSKYFLRRSHFYCLTRWARIHFRSHPHALAKAVTKAVMSPFSFWLRLSIVLPYIGSFYVWRVFFLPYHWCLPSYCVLQRCEIWYCANPTRHISLCTLQITNEKGWWASRTNLATYRSPSNLHHKTTWA